MSARVTVIVQWLAALALGAASFAATSGLLDDFRTIDFEFTGRVLDADTKEPIEGAYVIASYFIQRSGLAATNIFCVKTKGMYTGKDGKYHFPVERLDNLSPHMTNAIKPDYFWLKSYIPKGAVQRKQNAEAYSGRDIYLKKQDPASPEFRVSGGEEFCTEAATREAATAGIEFTKIKLREAIEYKASAQGIDAIQYKIRRMEQTSLASGKF